MECVESNANIGFICVPPEGGFPCADGACPEGFDCFFGMCFARCDNNPGNQCGEGFICIDIGGIDYCVPYPFPCDLYGSGCPSDMYCYGGNCYPLCNNSILPNGGCEDGFSCLQIGTDVNGQPITICYPDNPPEGYINDGKLNFVDDHDNYLTVFTANQYGDTYLRFSGIDIEGGSGEGGGSGASITFNTLWKRVDEHLGPNTKQDADIQPRYVDVDAVPNGVNCNIGYDPFKLDQPSDSTTDRWDGVFTRDLNISRRVWGNLINFRDNHQDLGSASNRWRQTHTYDFHITHEVTGHLIPSSTDTYTVGNPSQRWKHVYTNDLHLSNENGSNDVDGTWGDYTIQEGENDLFIINRRNGKRYRFNLEEV
jgi:hypothetical protein